MSNISKVAKTKMEVTAEYQKLSDLNVAFYNQDINTAILQFNVTRNDAPVPLGKTNVDGYIVLLHEDGSRIQDNLVIVNEEHGVIQYTIPREFLKHTGKVLGQVYIAVKGRDDTAVMRQFSFDIKNDLLTGFSSAVKLEYIKTFDDLKEQIKQRIEAIEEAIANGEDYVAQMIATLDTGKKEVAATVTKANTDINKVANDAKNNVTVIADAATKKITNAATKASEDINKVSVDTTKKITDTSNAAVATVNSKGDAVLKSFAENGQLQKITNDDGSSITVSGYDLLNVEDVKNYDGYVTNPKNSPSSGGSGYFKRKYRDGYIEITFAPHSQKIVYRNAYNFSTKLWVGWEKMVTSSELASVIGSNTGWLPLPLLNGVTASVTCYYRFYSTNGIYYLSFKGVLNTLPTRDVIVAKLPADVATKIDRPLTWVGNTSASANAARFNRWVVEMDGKIKFATSNFGTDGESGAWNPLDVTLTL